MITCDEHSQQYMRPLLNFKLVRYTDPGEVQLQWMQSRGNNNIVKYRVSVQKLRWKKKHDCGIFSSFGKSSWEKSSFRCEYRQIIIYLYRYIKHWSSIYMHTYVSLHVDTTTRPDIVPRDFVLFFRLYERVCGSRTTLYILYYYYTHWNISLLLFSTHREHNILVPNNNNVTIVQPHIHDNNIIHIRVGNTWWVYIILCIYTWWVLARTLQFAVVYIFTQ